MVLGKRNFGQYKTTTTTTRAAKPVYAKRRRTGAGYVRTVGFYGRFRGRSAGAGGEQKFFDTTFAEATVASAGAITNPSLNLIPQGVTESTRVGRKCVIKKIHFKGELKMPSSATSTLTADRLRVIVFIDKQANGAAATVASILETASIDSFRNLAESGRFLILHDKTSDLNSGSGAGNTAAGVLWGETKRTWRLNKTCNLPIEFSSTTGVITEIRSNNIGVLAISEAGLATLQYTCRVRFSDS